MKPESNDERSARIEALFRTTKTTPFSRLAYHLAKAEEKEINALLADDIAWTMMPNGMTVKGKAQVYGFLKSAFMSIKERRPDIIGNEQSNGWGVFEYMNIGTIDENAIAFAQAFWGKNRIQINSSDILGKEYNVAVCFVYHLNSQGKIDLVREYMDTGSFVMQSHSLPQGGAQPEQRRG